MKTTTLPAAKAARSESSWTTEHPAPDQAHANRSVRFRLSHALLAASKVFFVHLDLKLSARMKTGSAVKSQQQPRAAVLGRLLLKADIEAAVFELGAGDF